VEREKVWRTTSKIKDHFTPGKDKIMKRIVFCMSLAIILLSFPSHGFSQLEGTLDQHHLDSLADRIAQEGKIAAVNAILTGSIIPFGESIRLSVKVLDTETAMIIAASSGNIARTEAITELLKRGVESSQPWAS
jgi:hypothetical protein